eukprot:scaffold436_cov267-Pinguiococcus_pyrenoidosus.AAC.1
MLLDSKGEWPERARRKGGRGGGEAPESKCLVPSAHGGRRDHRAPALCHASDPTRDSVASGALLDLSSPRRRRRHSADHATHAARTRQKDHEDRIKVSCCLEPTSHVVVEGGVELPPVDHVCLGGASEGVFQALQLLFAKVDSGPG